jgi:hypothetical protein
MALRHGKDSEIVGALAVLAGSQTRYEAFSSLVDLNWECFELLAEQALAQPAQTNLLLRQVGELWRTLDSRARSRAATCPYLLVDAGFADPNRWRRPENEPRSAPCTTFFTVRRASAVARQVFMYAWHLSQSKNFAAQLLLGMPTRCTHLIGSCTLSQIHELAERHPDWMCPRWPNLVSFWRELLLAAASGEFVALENARMRGLRLLAAELRVASTQAVDQTRPSESARAVVRRGNP